MSKSTDVWSSIHLPNPCTGCLRSFDHVFSLLKHIKQLFIQMVIEYSLPHKDRSSIL